jgi:bifunctional DNase/RNase
MVEVKIDSIRVSLMSQHRVVILKDMNSERYLPIWIGPYEADAITIQLQEVAVARPLTHDLLKTVITEMGGSIKQVVVSDLRHDTFYASITVERNGKTVEIDSRPSDAIALAVRAGVPIYVDESVMDKAAITPEEEEEGEETPSAFKDLIEGLDLDKLGS